MGDEEISKVEATSAACGILVRENCPKGKEPWLFPHWQMGIRPAAG